ncbi:MAG: hypothetical protein V8R82_08860 [Clostridia bacterium]
MSKNIKVKHHKAAKEKNNKKLKLMLIIGLISIIVIMIVVIKNKNGTTKISKIGNNSSSQEIVDYILNIESYNSEVDVEIKSNKNSNKYKLKQNYIKDEKSIQEVVEPQNIQGVKIINEKNNLKIENTNLSLTKIIENYQDIANNQLDLSTFITDYKNNNNSKFTEKENKIIMETTSQNESQYRKYETLYISKENGKPEKMEIKDTNQNVIIYIIYNEININDN